MKVLAIETSGQTSSVALVERGRRVVERLFASKMRLNQTLAAHARDVCGCERLAEAGLDGIAAGIGPGSFTGVRMGVAVAKAIAHALELPLVGVSAPQAMAAALPARPGYRICVLQRARANEVYVTALRSETGRLAAEVGPTEALRVHRALRMAEERLGGPPDLVCGDAAREHCVLIEAVFEFARLADDLFSIPRAAVIAEIAAAQLAQADSQAAFSLRPRYVRLSQAEREHGVDLELR